MSTTQEKEYMVYNEGEIRSIGNGFRKIFVKETKKFAYIRDNFGRRIRFKLRVWENLRDNVFKLNKEK